MYPTRRTHTAKVKRTTSLPGKMGRAGLECRVLSQSMRLQTIRGSKKRIGKSWMTGTRSSRMCPLFILTSICADSCPAENAIMLWAGSLVVQVLQLSSKSTIFTSVIVAFNLVHLYYFAFTSLKLLRCRRARISK